MTHEMGGARFRVDDPERTIAQVHDWAVRQDAEVAVADARSVFGRDHLETAVRHALRAQANETMVARTVSMETLRYLAAQRQVSDAIRAAGIRRGTDRIAVVVFGTASLDAFLAAVGWPRDDEVLSVRGKDLRVLGVAADEAKTVPESRRADLALERVALLDVTR